MLNKGFLTWLSNNKGTFVLVILVMAIGVLYRDNQKKDDRIEALNEKIILHQVEDTKYEKERSEKLQFLLNNLVKTSNNDTK